MITRGPKPKTAKKAAQKPPRTISLDQLTPPSDLDAEANSEFVRLVRVLDNRGTLDRIDLAVLAECARIKGLLDRVHCSLGRSSPDLSTLKMIGLLTTQRRGLLRELGLTLQPSRSVVKTTAKQPEDADPLAKLIKLSG